MKRLFCFFLLLFLSAACAPEVVVSDTPAVKTVAALTPYLPAASTGTPPLAEQSTPTALPAQTSTPRTHVVKKGEDLGGIAFQYGVLLAALMEANPDVNPNLLSVGTVLVIPAASGKVDTENLPHPTPVTVNLAPVHCFRGGGGGAWCFLMVSNPQEGAVENVTVEIRVIGGDVQLSQTVTSPLNVIQGGGQLPLAAYFAAPLPDSFQAGASLLTALPRPIEDQRYLPVEVSGFEAAIQPGGLAAAASGQIILPGEEADASQVWVVLAALDGGGQIVGVRRWEGSGHLSPENPLPFKAWVYSAAGSPIEQVLVWAEARP
ncbi:MAG: LysM peptidoglycan-binding domain-containing protein [Anaerolineaceae bacterium]|nr:LysM peptidoglycan-binding domain-containing protein [Anaerolineaceae bacterium]